jgi:hypothetical protein
MLDQLTKFISLAALTGLYLAALFNIGFFYALGYHFIGVIDVSNIVYTFGLVVLFVFIGISLVSLAALILSGAKDLWIKLPDWLKGLMIVCALLAAIVLLLLMFKVKNTDTKTLEVALLFPTFGVAFAAIARLVWIQQRRIEYFLVGVSIASVSCGAFASGVALATHPLDQQTYDVLTKTGNILGVRIARSSSNGFILVKNKDVTFVPTGEVRSISTTIPQHDEN